MLQNEEDQYEADHLGQVRAACHSWDSSWVEVVEVLDHEIILQVIGGLAAASPPSVEEVLDEAAHGQGD